MYGRGVVMVAHQARPREEPTGTQRAGQQVAAVPDVGQQSDATADQQTERLRVVAFVDR